MIGAAVTRAETVRVIQWMADVKSSHGGAYYPSSNCPLAAKEERASLRAALTSLR